MRTNFGTQGTFQTHHRRDEMKRLAATSRGSLRSTRRVSPCAKQGPHKEQPAMVYGAIDLHTRRSEIRMVDSEGRVIREQRIGTTADRLVAAFAGVGPVRILLEAGTESEWVACALEGVGYEVVVADPNYAPMYGDRHRGVKTDRGDVAALAEANRHGWFRRAYGRWVGQRPLQQQLTS